MHGYTERQEQYIRSFMFGIDVLLADVLSPTEGDGDWRALLERRLDNGSMILGTVAAAATVATVAAPFTGGASLAVIGGVGAAAVTAEACIVIAQAMNGAYKIVSQTEADKTDSVAEDALSLGEQRLLLRLSLSEVADLAALQYAHFINEVIKESSLQAFAHYGAERVMKKLRDELKSQLKVHAENVLPVAQSSATTPAQQTIPFSIEPLKLIEYLMQSTNLSVLHSSEKIKINKTYAPRSLISSNDVPAKWGYGRARVGFYRENNPSSITWYASPSENAYLLTDTTERKFGYMLIPTKTSLSHQIKLYDRQLVLLDHTTLNIEQEVTPHLCLPYFVTRDEVSSYLIAVHTSPTLTLNHYLSTQCGVNVIATCHNEDLQGLPLAHGNFTSVNFRRANLEGCDLTSTIWDKAQMATARFKSNVMSGCSFKATSLENSIWSEVALMGNFFEARMNGAKIKGCTITSQWIHLNCNMDLVEMDDKVHIEGGEKELKDYFEARLTTELKTRAVIEADTKRTYNEWQQKQEEKWTALAKSNEEVVARVDKLEAWQRMVGEQPIIDILKKVRAQGDALFDSAILQPYVDLTVLSAGGSEKRACTLSERLDDFMDAPLEQFIILEGELGSGKSLSTRRWQQELIHEYQDREQDWLPIIIPVADIDSNKGQDNFLDLAIASFLKNELLVEVLKNQFRCIIILDGLDERKASFAQRYLIEECANSKQWKSKPKILVACQSRYLVEEPDYRERLRLSPQLKFPLESQITIQPLSEIQIRAYLRAYYPGGIDFSNPRFQEIKAMTQSPLMLHIISEVLHAAEPNAILPLTRVAFYDDFFHNWYSYVKLKAPDEHFSENSIPTYIQRIAYQMFSEKKDRVERPYDTDVKDVLQIEEDARKPYDPNSFTYLFDSDIWKKAGTLTPLSVTLNDNELPWMLSYEFKHSSFKHYALAKKLVTILEREPAEEKKKAWNCNYLAATPNVFDFLQELLQTHPKKALIQQSLLKMVEASQGISGKKWGKAASNAITLLNRLGFDFSAHFQKTPAAWKGIRVPKANLRFALLANLDLSFSDFSDVRFHGAELGGTQLVEITAEGTRFSDALSIIYTEDHPETFAVHPSDERIVAYSKASGSGSRQNEIVIVGVNGSAFQGFNGYKKVVTSMSFSPSGYFLGVGNARGTVRVLDMGLAKEHMKLRFAEKVPIRSLSWLDSKLLASGGEDRVVTSRRI